MATRTKGNTRAKVPTRAIAEDHPIFHATPGIDDRLIAVYHKVLAKYGHRPEVTGVDIGLQRRSGMETGVLAVRVHVLEKVAKRYLTGRELFPRQIDGVPIDVIEAAYVRQVGAGAARFSTLQPGISIGHPRLHGSGTLGLFVRDGHDANLKYLLSASHVIVPDNHSHAGDPVFQAGASDGGHAPADTVANVSRFCLKVDAAIAVLSDSRPSIDQQLGTTTIISSVRAPAINDVLTKSGRTTDVTTARVDGVSGPYGDIQASFHLVPVRLDDPKLICDFGDSGAIWFDAKTGAGVGMHCMGAPNPTPGHQYAVATLLTEVFSRLKVTL